MKKILLVCAFAMVSIMSFAGGLKTKSGDIAVLKEAANATFELNIDGATWEKKEDFKTWCEEDYDVRVKSMQETFPTSFNKYTSGLKIADQSPKYKVVLTINNFERKQGMGLWGSCYITISGTLDIQDAATGSTVLSVEVKNQGGDTDFVENDRFPKTIDELCKKLFKMKK